MPSNLRIWTLDHRTADQRQRERFAVPPESVPLRLAEVRQRAGVDEAMVVSTCNRILWLTVGGTPTVVDFAEPIEGTAALRHLARVAAGLESLVVGEPQILGQVRDAWKLSRQARMSGPELEFLMPRLLGLAKRVRKESGLGTGATSVAHLGVEQALRAFSGPQSPRVLVIGAGKMAAIAVREARARGARTVHVANRTFANAVTLGNAYGACPVDYSRIYAMIASGEVNVVICACAAPHPVLTPVHLRSRACNTPLLVIADLALPRNVDPAVADLPGVHFIDLDSLAGAVRAGQSRRTECAAAAEAVFEARFQEFLRRCEHRGRHSLIAALERESEEIRTAELRRARGLLSGISDSDWSNVERLTHRLLRKMMHRSIAGLQ